ncbi:MAG: RagB/SusD family nutrient uptake outer membrane protein [Prevotellaceae bacterium]|jgi:hypothetical protein|nr:RagB/SusD family nutrient uptake outer membrane protein [Prevotellaceae bacterium]
MKKYNCLLLVAVVASLVSCDSFLEPEKDGKLLEQDVWESQTKYAFGILNSAYSNLHKGYNRIDGAMLAAASDEAIHNDLTSSIKGFNDGTWGPYFPIENVWDNHYNGISKVNEFFENIDRVPIPNEGISIEGSTQELILTRERMKGEAFFLRAFFYFELIKRYGGVPLITKTLTPDEAKSAVRASYDDCMELILRDCDSAIVRLPERYISVQSGAIVGYNQDSNLGRATSIAALALKSRALLYWGSPLNNTAEDKERYKAAADAAQKVIQSKIPGLLSFYEGESFSDLYVVSQYFPQYNKEIIFSTTYYSATEVERQNALITAGGRGLTSPTQNLSNAFGMKNGNAGYDTGNPYADRDPRFYMTLAHNGYAYTMNGRGATVDTYTGGKDAAGTYKTATRTGYYLNKFLSKQAVWDGSTNNVTRTWIFIRYAEVLLNYAEAANEYFDSPNDSVYITLELVRKRAGLSPYTITRNKTKEEMREIIQNERRIELAFEEHRFFDVRRWRLFDDPVKKEDYLNIKGIRITKNGDDFLYEEYPVEKRVFEEKMYRYPIPQTEILKAPGIIQNKDW